MNALTHPDRQICLQFDKVSFSYHDGGQVLKNAAFHIHQG